MGSELKLVEFSSADEKRVVTGLITSDEFAKAIIPNLDLAYFTNPYLHRVATWCVVFFEEHGKVPFKHIKDIFDTERPRLKENEAELISTLLAGLSDQYDDSSSVNVEYLVQSAEEFFRKRELEIHVNNISVLKEKGDYTAAELEIQRFNRVSLSLDESLYIDLGCQRTRDDLYTKLFERQKEFFKFPGDLGVFLGNIKPGDVVGITAPKKRFKSFLLNDFFKHAITSKIKTLKWAIEMTDTEEIERFDKLFFPTVDKRSGMYKYPVFDCMKNQTGDCGDRLSKVIVRDEPKADFQDNPEHEPCTKCRDTDPSRFAPCTYNMDIHRTQAEQSTILNGMESYKNMLSKYARLVVRPKYTLTYDLMMYDLDKMESRYNFIPQMLLIDYVDILGINSNFDDYRLEDEKWKLLQRIASATRCAVITPTQSNKDGELATTMRSVDQGGFYGKGRHVNLMLGINQTADEKRNGLYRISIMDSRSQRSNEFDYCIVLQDIKAGQVHLDSFFPGKNYHY